MIDPGLRLPANLAEGDRRLRLLSVHDDHFQRWLESLPSPLAALAAEPSTYFGADVEPPSAGDPLRSPAAIATAWLFWGTFEDVSDETFLAIAGDGACLQLASVILDHLADGQFPDPGPASLLYKALMDRGHSGFRKLFPAGSAFWSHYEDLGQRHLAGLAAELEGRSDPRYFTYEKLETMASGKACPVVVTIAALCEASRRTALFEPIARSMERVGAASQLVDDVRDCRQDTEARHLTHFLSCLGPADTWSDSAWPSVHELERRLEPSLVETDHLRQAVSLYDQAIQEVKGISCPDWVSYISRKRLDAERRLMAALASALATSLSSEPRSASG